VGRMPVEELLELMRELPVRARVALGALFLATTAQMLASSTGVQTELGFKRIFVAIPIWLCSGAAALAYAQHRRLSRGTPLTPLVMSQGRKRLFKVLYAVGGVALAAGLFLANQNSVYDEKAEHDRLAVAFGHSSWYPHLKAANTSGDGLRVYLDTRDPAVQEAACADLAREAAKLYYVSAGGGSFLRQCR
jgi:hypothetical protein